MDSAASPAPATLEDLHERASRPCRETAAVLARFPGTVLVLGAGGKMGYHLSRALQRASGEAGNPARVLAVSRFGDERALKSFHDAGVATLSCDLEDDAQLARLPDASLVFFLAGIKFGTAERPDLLARFNVEMPRLVTSRFRGAALVGLSSGCVYPFSDVRGSGSRESDPVDPPGDYARSCVGREGAFFEAARLWHTHSVLIRLNYSVDLRYGVLVDIARRVLAGEPVDLSTGWVNVIWQGDAVNVVIRAAEWAAAPPEILNVTGPRKLAVRETALEFGRLFGKPVRFVGTESETAWLSDVSKMMQRFGEPSVSNETLIRWAADWLARGGETLGKPTRFEVRHGDF